MMTTLNGLHGSWDSFIQGICANKKLLKFSRLWEEWSQEESRIAAWEENMGSEDQTLTVQSNKNRRDHHHHHHSKGKHSCYNKSQLRCYTCDEIGHFARDSPRNKRNPHKKKKEKTSFSCCRRWWTFLKEKQARKWWFFKWWRICFDFHSHEKHHTWKQWLDYRQWGFQTYDGIQRVFCDTIITWITSQGETWRWLPVSNKR